MAVSDIREILLKFDRWAMGQMLAACAPLSEAQFHERFEMGPGSLHDTLTHILGATRLWTQVLAGGTVGPRLDQEGRRRTPAELSALAEEILPAFAAEAVRRPLDEMATRVREGMTMHLTRGAIIAQVTTHAVHHRAQCLNMLRRLGVEKLPQSAAVQWALAEGS